MPIYRSNSPGHRIWATCTKRRSQVTKITRSENAAHSHLCAGAKGFGGEWQLELSNATKFFWDDWALPVCDKLTVICSDANASIKLSLDGDQTQVSFVRSLDGWKCETPHELCACRRSAVGSIDSFYFPVCSA
jgi:hypothetical protein